MVLVDFLVTDPRGGGGHFEREPRVPIEFLHVHRYLAPRIVHAAVLTRWRAPCTTAYHLTFLGWCGDYAAFGAAALLFALDHPCGSRYLVYAVRADEATAPVFLPYEWELAWRDCCAAFRTVNNTHVFDPVALSVVGDDGIFGYPASNWKRRSPSSGQQDEGTTA